MNRRYFFKGAVASTAVPIFGASLAIFDDPESELPLAAYNIMEDVRKYRKIDAHAHVALTSNPSPAWEVDFAERLNIAKLIASKPVDRNLEGNPEEFRACNDRVMECMRKSPDRIIGQMTLNPRFQKESFEEIRRCMDLGMYGLKVYSHVNINDPLFYPIIEKFIDLNMIILMHVGVGRSRIIFDPGEARSTSTAEDFVAIAKRFPEAMFQFAHLAGGGDWEASCKTLKYSSNVYVDISGSNNDANIIDLALEYLGEDRILFGCDNSFYQGVGHVLAANLTDEQRRKIYFENYNNILKKSGRHVN
ncbi:MAG: amidohydrolase [Saprospiraceae bacterium]|nr:amidohydrolase [Saprospiraceae bacterium]